MKAMVFAAGLGTRLQNETSDKPKALVSVGGKPLLQHAIEKLKNEGVEEIVVNVHHFSKLVKDFLKENNFGIPIHISDESGELLDTGGGLKKAVPFFTGSTPILIYNVDVLSSLNLQLLKAEHLKSKALVTLVVRNRNTQRYFKFDSGKQLTGWLNKTTGEKKISRPGSFETSLEMAFSGIHIVQPEIFKFMPVADKFSITDFYLELAKTESIKGFFDNSELWIDVGKPEQLAVARKRLG
ncbi:MAG: nucleotidyltransferase family protein [Prolixibacteraceae bacterium]|nr:nucleotidyltransferase family protein [Prolixibacteraceae bacterium]